MTLNSFLKNFTMIILKRFLNDDTKSFKRFLNDDIKKVEKGSLIMVSKQFKNFHNDDTKKFKNFP